jgi:dTMP kinase
VLAVGGLVAIAVSMFTGQQIGGLTSGLTRRIFGRRALNIWDEQDDHAGVLIAVEGADAAAVSHYAGLIEAHVRTDGWRIERVTAQSAVDDTPLSAGFDSPAAALRASADLGDLTTDRIEPALRAGAVVVCEGFIDATIVRYRAAGVEEQRLARVAQWAVNGLKADLTVLVDGVPGTDLAVTGGQSNGLALDGGQPNGLAVDGGRPNGLAVDGGQPNGLGVDGGQPNGLAVDGGQPNGLAVNGGAVHPSGDGELSESQSTPSGLRQTTENPSPAADRAVAEDGDGPAPDTAGAGIDQAPVAIIDDHESAHPVTSEDDDEPVDPVQAYRDRASYTPERYLVVRPLAEEKNVINPEVVARISSVLRLRSPSLAEPQTTS